jgi:hypothetical protein
LYLRHTSFEVKRPHILNLVKTLPDTMIKMNVICVKEERPPKGKAPIEWCLATIRLMPE